MSDNYRIDSHKLIYHPSIVSDWLKGKTVCPIYLEIAPAGGCNHRCIFCALDYLKYEPIFLDIKVLKKAINQAGGLGVKSVMYAGEGEPLLYKDIVQIVSYTKNKGMDAAITTNGVLLDEKKINDLLKYLNWIRVSFNAGKSKTYAKIHRTKEEDFYKVLENIKNAVSYRNKNRLSATIGVQLLLIPENVDEVFGLANIVKKAGVDYFSIKPYSQHPLSSSRIDARFNYNNYFYMSKKLKVLENMRFKIVFREHTMERLFSEKGYKHCLGLPFWAYISAKGDIYACSAFLGKKEFCYGNLYKNSFKNIMNGARRKQVIERVSSRLDVDKCREVCRLDKINNYLWELKNPGPHVNFI